jgi:hypothetical protein
VISLVIGVFLMVLTIVAYIQIITKAGYSPWWILLPLSLPVLWIISIATAFSGLSGVGTYGLFNVQGVADSAEVLGVVTLLDVLLNFVFLLIFAFSDWPVMQAARSRHAPRTGGGGRGRAEPPAGPIGPTPTPLPAVVPGSDGQPPGWVKTGPMGSGEESYWDGAAWTAKRRWSEGAWVDLPFVPVGPHGATQPTA